MKQFLTLVVLVMCALCLGNSCKSDENELPAPTTEGLNTFGCKLNGRTWIAGPVTNERGESAKAFEIKFEKLTPGTFSLFILANSNNRERVQLSLPKGVTGNNVLKNMPNDPFGIYYDNQFRIFHSMEANPGTVVITRLDTVNNIVSGTFEFDAQFVVNKEIVKVTEGRFDIDVDDWK